MSAADGPVEFDPADFGTVPSSRALRRWMRSTRRRHADRSFWEIFEDVYLVLFTLAMAGASGGNVVRHLNSSAAGCTSSACGELAAALPWIAVPLLLATTLRVLLAVGPVSASRATGFWLLATPVDRGALLRPTYRVVVGVVAAIGVLAGAVTWALVGAAWGDVLAVALLIGALLVCAAVAAVWAQQSKRRSRWALRASDVLLAVAILPALALALRPDPTSSVQTANVIIAEYDSRAVEDRSYLVVLGVAAAVLLGAVLAVFAARTLDRLSRVSVIAGGELLAGLAGAASSLDISMLGDVIAGRHWRLKGRVRSHRGRGANGVAIVHREFRRILRWPRRLAVAFALLVVPYAVHGLGVAVLVPVAAAIAGFIAVRPLLDGLRTACRSTGLARAMGMEVRDLRIVMAVVPALFTALWVLLAAPAIGSPAPSFAVAAGIISGTVRQASARPPSYAGPLLTSPMGAIPPGLFSQPARGLDLLILCLAPVLLNLGTLWVVAIPTAVLAVMFAVRPKTD
ncbi:DUF6297 family protein [Kribbella sp. HUAS MG21]|uniref:DUF6297 family protein n=1 Tax=Kribbella sp. HUAS MG21 TaxID=3160966 RepID=A0AAU7TCA4_9ACTN